MYNFKVLCEALTEVNETLFECNKAIELYQNAAKTVAAYDKATKLMEHITAAGTIIDDLLEGELSTENRLLLLFTELPNTAMLERIIENLERN